MGAHEMLGAVSFQGPETEGEGAGLDPVCPPPLVPAPRPPSFLSLTWEIPRWVVYMAETCLLPASRPEARDRGVEGLLGLPPRGGDGCLSLRAPTPPSGVSGPASPPVSTPVTRMKAHPEELF